MENVALTFTESALTAIAKKANKRKTGARGLRSIMEAVLLDSMFDLPDMKDVHEIVINDDVIEGKSEPLKVLSSHGDIDIEKKTRPKPAKTH